MSGDLGGGSATSGGSDGSYDAREAAALFALPPVPPDLTVRYGPHPDQLVDHYLPRTAPKGLTVVLLHGGFWRPAYDRAHLTPLAAALALEGYEVRLPEYRRTGCPEILDDAAAAVDTSVAGRTVLVGHSAGGHLALWAASRHRLPAGHRNRTAGPPTGVRRVVGLAAVADLAAADRAGLGGGAVREHLTGDPEELGAADPARLLPAGVPVLLAHGREDAAVPHTVADSYAAAARAAGQADLEVRLLPATGHYSLVDPCTAVLANLLRTEVG